MSGSIGVYDRIFISVSFEVLLSSMFLDIELPAYMGCAGITSIIDYLLLLLCWSECPRADLL